jgi:putative peptidoglycan lipid II flippase
MTDSLLTDTPVAEETRGLARSASIIALGNVASRVLGLIREQVIAGLFGTGAHVDALTLAITVPVQIYELVTGGLVNSALVPVFSEYTPEARRAELWRLASILLSLAAAAVSLFVGALVLFAPQVVAVFALLGQGKNPDAQAQAAQLLRLTLPAVIFLSLSGIVSGLLYSLRRFTLPAFTAAVFNASLVVVSLLFARRFGVGATALGLLVGAALQVILQLPALRDARLRPTLDFRHPGLRRIFTLYVPIILGLVITQLSIYFGLALAWEFTGGLSWMRYATTLYQFPLGLVATAVSFAILPTLSRQAKQLEGTGDFKTTLVQGLNLVSLLIIPATVGLFVLARPIVALAFERGEFTAHDTGMTALVLQLFLLGLSFAALDQILIFAFYARQDTLTPALVGVFSVLVYVGVALALRGALGVFSLMIADSVKQVTHALVTGALLSRRVGGFRRAGLWPTLGKVVFAALAMGALAAAALLGVQALGLRPGAVERLARVAVPGVVGVVVYFALATRLHIAEAQVVFAMIRRRLGV